MHSRSLSLSLSRGGTKFSFVCGAVCCCCQHEMIRGIDDVTSNRIVCSYVWLDKCRDRDLERDKRVLCEGETQFPIRPSVQAPVRLTCVFTCITFYIVIHFPQEYLSITYSLLRITLLNCIYSHNSNGDDDDDNDDDDYYEYKDETTNQPTIYPYMHDMNTLLYVYEIRTKTHAYSEYRRVGTHFSNCVYITALIRLIQTKTESYITRTTCIFVCVFFRFIFNHLHLKYCVCFFHGY